MFYINRDPLSDDLGVQDGKTKGPGMSFGELALLYNSPRPSTVRAVGNAKVWAIDRFTFRRLSRRLGEQKLLQYESFLARCSLFAQNLSERDRARVAEAFEEVEFQVREGEALVGNGGRRRERGSEGARDAKEGWKERIGGREAGKISPPSSLSLPSLPLSLLALPFPLAPPRPALRS